jgi:hypothetical protein
MKYEEGSLIDKKMHNFPVRYIFYMFIIWFAIIGGLIYLGVK